MRFPGPIAALLSSSVTNVRRFLRPLPVPVLVVIGLPYALAVSFITSVGGQLQQYALGILNGDAPSLYEAVYDEAIVRFPTLSDWLAYGLSGRALFIGVFVALISIRRRSFENVIRASLLATPVALTIVDLFGELWLSKFSLSSLLTNLFSNAVGGVVAALLGSVSLLTLLSIVGTQRRASAAHVLAGGVAAVCVGVFVSTTAYCTFGFLFQPVSQKLDIVLGAPVTGMTFSPVNSENSGTHSESNKFAFLPSGDVGGSVDLNSPSGQLNILWSSLRPDILYDMSIYLIIDCPGQTIDQLPKGEPLFEIESISKVKLSMSSGLTNFSLSKGNSNSYTFAPTGPVAYWIAPDGKSNLKITHFVSPEDPIEARVSADVALYIGGPTMQVEDRASVPTDRTLTITANDKRIVVHYRRAPLAEPNRKLQCRVADRSAGSDNPQIVDVHEEALWGGALIQFSPSQSRREYSFQDAKLHLTGANGWFSVEGVDPHRLGDDNLGETGLLSFSGSVDNLRASGIKVDVNQHDVFVAIGRINAHYLLDGKISVTGIANMLWRNGDRLSPTKWERMPLEAKLTLLPIILSLLGGLLEFCRREIKKRLQEDVGGALI